MQKQQAINIVHETFEQTFDKARFTHFIKNLLNEPDLADGFGPRAGSHIPDVFKGYIEKYERIGKFEDSDEKRIDLLIVHLKRETSIERGRSMQRNFVAGYLQGRYGSDQQNDAALVAFVSPNGVDWRFSLVKLEARIEVGEKGIKVVDEFSPARRWSFLVGANEKSHTAQTQFLPIMQDTENNPTLARLEEAFNVETVTKEFFREYRRIFEETEATLKIKWTDEHKRIYTQRFFNRVMFIAFLEKKGWLTFNGRKDYLRALIEDYAKNQKDKNANFHRSRLNTLFFMGLNHPSGDKRQKAEYKPILSLIGDVPYLNGGLFEEEEDDKDGPTFPDGSIAKVLNELVYQFNFTVTESTPLDVEVAVDPEMLGRIFEELVTGRHDSGSYYTPKPVVAFMCREALKGYLATALPSESAEGLALFVDKNDAKSIRNPMQVVDALRAVKVCDPACGSGAYLLGMLHELLEQYAVIFAQHQKDGQTIYQTKLNIIQNNLYGVDKDDFAVNIARLRLWLSLIVDFEGETPPPLPNLDFKIECGDSLTAPDPSGGLQPDMFRQQQVKEFLALKNAYMDVHEGSEKKKKLGKQIDELKKQIEAWAHPKGYDKEIDSFDWQVDFAEVFAPELAESTLGGKMTGLVNTTKGQMEMTDAPKEGGFDIVIGNPPYVQLQKEGGRLAKMFEKTGYKTFERTGDIYSLFYERGWQMLKNKGLLCFITSNKWMRAGYGESTRKFFAENTNPILLIDFAGYKIFQSATVDVNILMFSKDKNQQKTLSYIVKEDVLNELSVFVRQQGVECNFSTKESWTILSPIEQSIKKKIEAIGTPLKDWDIQINYGIKTGFNDAFIIDGSKRKELIAQDPKSDEIIRPILRGRDIKRYGYEFADLYLIATFPSLKIDIEKYPAVKKHLLSFGMERLEQTGKEYKINGETAKARKKTANKWFETQDSISYWDDFSKQKIVWGEISDNANFALDESDGFFINNKCYLMTGSKLEYLVCYLNSPLSEYLFSKIATTTGVGTLQWSKFTIEQLPIPAVTNEQEKEFASLLFALRAKRINITNINLRIYEICGLTIEEIAFIENHSDSL